MSKDQSAKPIINTGRLEAYKIKKPLLAKLDKSMELRRYMTLGGKTPPRSASAVPQRLSGHRCRRARAEQRQVHCRHSDVQRSAFTPARRARQALFIGGRVNELDRQLLLELVAAARRASSVLQSDSSVDRFNASGRLERALLNFELKSKFLLEQIAQGGA